MSSTHRSSVRTGTSALVLVFFLGLSLVVALSGMAFPPGDWYEGLDKPWFTPPSWIFGPAWTLLYTLMAVAAWLVWRAAGLSRARVALAAYLVQLTCNAAWSWLFFGLHRMDLAFFDIVALWLAIAATIAAFSRIHRLAALLLAPYLAWVSFAAALNLALWQLNG